MSTTSYDCIVIGSGPGGYVAAIRSAQLGLKTAVIEREAPGGICLNWGCIPTKALLKSAEIYETIKDANQFGITVGQVQFNYSSILERSRKVVHRMTKGVEFLLKKNKVDLILGEARLNGGNHLFVNCQDGAQKVFDYDKVILATGARARTIPALPVDRERILTSRELLSLSTAPEKLLVIGAGAIGVEFAYLFNTFGTKTTLVEVLPNILPIEDQEISSQLEKTFKKKGIQVCTQTKVEKLWREGETVKAQLNINGNTEQWTGDYCLVAIGLQGNIENLGLEGSGIEIKNSFVVTDQYYRTSSPDIYAIGDLIGPPLLAHVASHEGIIAAEHLAGINTHPLDYSSIPGCTYCKPQVASIGLSEKTALEKGKKIKIGRFPFSASGKAVASGESEGLVKVIIDQEFDEVLGVHILHAEATELLGEASVIRALEGTASAVANTIHAHPTLSEGIMEAMAVAQGRGIHI